MSALLITAVLGATAPNPVELSAEQRTPAAIVVLTPFGASSAVGTSRLVAAMARVLERRTDLRGQSPEQLGLDLDALSACPARRQLTCWSETVRSTAQGPGQSPAFIFGLAVRPLGDGRDRVTVTMLDVALAKRLRTSVDEDIEAELFRATPRSRPIVVSNRNDSSLISALEGLVSTHFESALTAAGRWNPFGSIEVSSPCEGCEVIVDGRLIGISRTGPLRITELRAGEHALQLRQSDTTILSCRTLSAVGQRVRVPAEACRARVPATDSASSRPWFRYGGLASSAAGIALVAVGAVQASSAPNGICVLPSSASTNDCRELGAPGLNLTTDGGLTDRREDINPSGVPTVAIGAGLIGMGATMAAGSWLWDEWPWWGQLLVGAAVGGAAVGIGTAIGGGS